MRRSVSAMKLVVAIALCSCSPGTPMAVHDARPADGSSDARPQRLIAYVAGFVGIVALP